MTLTTLPSLTGKAKALVDRPVRSHSVQSNSSRTDTDRPSPIPLEATATLSADDGPRHAWAPLFIIATSLALWVLIFQAISWVLT